MALLDETAELSGTFTTTACTLANGGTVATVFLSGPLVYQYGVALDRVPLTTLARWEGGIVSALGHQPDVVRVFGSLRDATDEEWAALIAAGEHPPTEPTSP